MDIPHLLGPFLLLPLGILVLVLLSESGLRSVLVALSWSSLPRRKMPWVPSGTLAVVVPAHEEAAAIGDTVTRLRAETAAGVVFVIADRCTDETAAVARAAGAQVWERHETGTYGKGAALRWFFDAAAQELDPYSGTAIFDADSKVEEGFFQGAMAALEAGADVVQGFLRPLGGGSSAADLAAYSEILSQRIDDVARSRLGWQVPLRGTGMVFRNEVLEALLPQLQTKVEDVEMSLLLAAQETRVRFVPSVVVGDPKATSTRGIAAQRGRWLQGQAEVWRRYWRDIIRLILTGGPSAWSLLCALLLKPKSFVLLLKTALFLCLWIAPLEPSWLNALLGGVGGCMLALDTAYFVYGLRFVNDRRRYAGALLASPLYLLAWLWSAGLMLASRDTWLRARD